MHCESVREQFTDYVIQGSSDALPPPVAEHLSTCQACRAEVEEVKAMWGSMAAIPAPEPGADARARFDLMVEAYRHGLDQSTTGTSKSSSESPAQRRWRSVNSWIGTWWPRQPALQFGFGLVLLIFGLAVGSRLRPAETTSDLQQSTEIAELRGELAGTKQVVALSLMQQQSASDRLRGVNSSYQVGQPGQEILTALLDTLTHDPSVNVRLATVDALRQFGDRPVVRQGVIEAMARQDSPMVQVALIDFAVDLGDRASIDTLRQLTQNQRTDVLVRERAEKGLAQLK